MSRCRREPRAAADAGAGPAWQRPGSHSPGADRSGPFALLGLDPAADLTDDEVRAAWRRIAAATHPDRGDGGDPERFAAAAAAYTELRTPFGRGEARAELTAPARPPAGRRPPQRTGARARPAAGRTPASLLAGRPRGLAGRLARPVWGLAGRIRSGRPGRLGLRILAGVAVGTAALLAAWPRPAAPALVTGVLTWLVLTGRHDLGPAAGPDGPDGPAGAAAPRPEPAAAQPGQLGQDGR